jgi:hypothetical protein
MSWSQIEAVTSDVSVGAVGAEGETRVLEVPKPKKVKVKADPVNSPEHYKVGGIETIDFIEAKSLGYNLGNVVKYISRADHKDDKLENLKKAQWYLNREVGKLEEK